MLVSITISTASTDHHVISETTMIVTEAIQQLHNKRNIYTRDRPVY